VLIIFYQCTISSPECYHYILRDQIRISTERASIAGCSLRASVSKCSSSCGLSAMLATQGFRFELYTDVKYMKFPRVCPPEYTWLNCWK
jgi:hypothetical protein